MCCLIESSEVQFSTFLPVVKYNVAGRIELACGVPDQVQNNIWNH